MKYVNVEDGHPVDEVDVFVVTDTGVVGVARYWSTIGKWITNDKNLYADTVVKWKYADANKFVKLCFAISNYISADTPAFKEQYLKEIEEIRNGQTNTKV